jgi:hypothetical protein
VGRKRSKGGWQMNSLSVPAIVIKGLTYVNKLKTIKNKPLNR